MSIALTWLYVPGDRPERFDKAVSSGADVVILDLEDAVAEADKDAAREHVRAYLAATGTRRRPELHVRVNDVTTPRGMDDLTAIAGLPALASVRLSKVESAELLDRVSDRLGPDVRIHALVESAAGLRAIDEIASHPAVAGIALGEQDLRSSLSLTDADGMRFIRLTAVLAAAAAGLEPVPMSVHPHVDDDAGLRESCAAGRAIGMLGRTAIHPRQLATIREAFRPDEAEVAWARSVVAAAESHSEGAFTLDGGEFVDRPIIDRADRVLTLSALSDETVA